MSRNLESCGRSDFWRRRQSSCVCELEQLKHDSPSARTSRPSRTPQACRAAAISDCQTLHVPVFHDHVVACAVAADNAGKCEQTPANRNPTFEWCVWKVSGA